MTRSEFQKYVQSFNALDTDTMRSYYCNDVQLHLPPKEIGALPRTLNGAEAIVNFYMSQAHLRQEHLEARFVVIERDRMAVEFYTEFRARRAVPEFFAGPLAPGEVFILVAFVLYELAGGKFKNIRVAPYTMAFKT